MTENKKSLIVEIIKQHPNDWEDLFSTKYPDINIKGCDRNENYKLFLYGQGANFNDKVVQEARGIIIDVTIPKVVCFPFRKFGKYFESYADTIDWNTACVQEKIDGSIIKLWWDESMNSWTFSTNSVIYAYDALVNEETGKTFLDVIRETENYSDILGLIRDGRLDKNNTYIFELTSKDNKIVISYEHSLLYHLGTRNNITGEEYDIDLGIIRPKRYGLHNLDECIQYATNMLNKDNTEDSKIHSCKDEGFVVVDANYNRVKVKSPIYTVIHNIVTGSSISREKLIDLLRNDKIDVDDICTEFSNLAPIISYYYYRVKELKKNATSIINISRRIYEDCGKDRKIVANLIKSNKYSKFVFMALDNDKTLDEILESQCKSASRLIMNTIPEYVPENYSSILSNYYNIYKM